MADWTVITADHAKRALGVVVIALLGVASVAMEASYVHALLGGGVGLAIVLAVVVGFHGFKAALLFVREGKGLIGRAAIWGLWGVLATLSVYATVGFLALKREAAVVARTAPTVSVLDAGIAETEARLRAIGTLRDAAVIESKITETLSRPAGSGQTVQTLTRGCEATAPATATVAACREVPSLRSELAEARTGARLRAEIENARRERKWEAKAVGVDLHMETLARFTGLEAGSISFWQIMLTALAIEAAVALGPWLLLGSSVASVMPTGGSRVPRRHAEAEGTSVRPSATVHPLPSRTAGNRTTATAQAEAFVRACLVAGNGAAASGSEIFEHYKRWCQAAGYAPLCANTIMPLIRDLTNARKVKGSTGRQEYRGIGIRVAA